MFQKDGSSTIGGKKDAPLRKSDRRRLRDRAVDVLFIGVSGSNNGNGGEGSCSASENEEWILRAEKLIDDAIVAPKGGDVLMRKMKLSGGEHATLYLRSPSASSVPADDSAAASATNGDGTVSYEDLLRSYPTTWPYSKTTQPILLECEDADRKVQLVPLLPLLAALPPPLSSPPLRKAADSNTEPTADDGKDDTKRYRMPNIVIHPEVSKYVCRGADLMKSGIRSFPSPWTLRQSKGLVTVSIIGNPQPIAVGMVDNGLFREYCYPKNGNRGSGARDWRCEAGNLVGPGMKGVGVTVVNCYGDDLWKSSLPPKSIIAISKVQEVGAFIDNPLGGGAYDDGNYGNAGFVDGRVVLPNLDLGGDDASGSDSDESDEEDGEKEDNTAGMENLNLSDPNEEGSVAEEATESEPNDEAKANEEPDHDEILLDAFYASLLLLLSSKVPLPMPVSTYYAKHLLATVPAAGPRLDMKQTTYKKIGPFLKEMESDGIIKLGASKDGKDRCAFLTDIAKNNPDLVQFKRRWKKEGGDALLAAGAAASQKTKLALVDLFIVPRHIADLMQLDKDAVMAANAKTEERRGTGFLTKTECRALIEGYIEKEDLVDPKGKGRVLVNGPLCDALYRASKKANKQQPGAPRAEYPTSVKRKDLIEKWLGKMEGAHALVQMPGSKILTLGRGGPKPVDIEVEFRQGNRRKFLTRLRGMEEYGVEGAALSQDVAHRFACSASVEADPVGRPALKKGRVEIVVQGHFSEELTALLTGDETLTGHGGVKGSEYNLPKSVVNVVLRKGVPARKKR